MQLKTINSQIFRKILLIGGFFLSGFFNSSVWADCGPINVGANTNWTAIGALTTCDPQLTTNGSSYTGNVELNGTGFAQTRVITVDINLTINGNLVITKNFGTLVTFRVAAGKTLTIVGNLGSLDQSKNYDVTYEVEAGAALIVTGTVYAGASPFTELFGGTGTISAGSITDAGDNSPDCDGACPIINVSTCTGGDICDPANNNSSTCDPNIGGTVSSDQSTCGANIDPAALTLTGYTGSILRWEQSINGGTDWTGLTSISDSSDPSLITQTTKYRSVVLNSGAGCTSYSTEVTVNVGGPSAAGAITGSATACSSTNGNAYSIAVVSNATSYVWTYSGTGVTINNGTTNSITLDFASNATSGILTAAGSNVGCGLGTSSNMSITVNAAPTITSTTPATRCGSGEVSLQAVASAGTINWYAASSGGGSLGTGTFYTTPTLAVSTTYYAEATNGGCVSSPRTAVVATVNSDPYSTVLDASANFVVPAGVTSLTIETWGAGGGGSSRAGQESGGGGGGAYSTGTVSVTAGASLPVTVGTGGGVGGSGGPSNFNGLIIANGGNATATATGGTGGAATVVVGVTSFAGGNGGNGTNNGGGGGGGGSALTSGIGSNGSNGGGTNGGNGGAGTGAGGTGASDNNSSDALAGNSPGGGGGGRGDGGGSGGTSKSGANGRVRITVINTISYTSASFCKSVTSAPVTFSGATGGAFTAIPSGLTINATTGEINPSTSTAGTYAVYYSVACGIVSNVDVTIVDLPIVSVTGSSSVCVNATTQLSPTTGGTWVSNTPTMASVTNGGVVTGVGAGSVNFTFTNTTTTCSNTTSSITVNSALVTVLDASANFVVPAGVTSLTIETWGAGGGGSSRAGQESGGGGGGAYSTGTVSVTAGASLPVTVGTGGGVGGSGGPSNFNGLIIANGGNATATATGGTGGAATVAVGVTSFAGGNGGNGKKNGGGGGGGGSALTSGIGSNGSNGLGTNGGNGGVGTGAGGKGASDNNSSDALAGTSPGGGGGGRGDGGGSGGTSKSGANGRVRITIQTPTISYSSPSYCQSASAALVTIGGMLGGTFTSSPAGLTLDATTGTITPATSSAGAYVVTYGTTCNPTLNTANVTILARPTTAVLSGTATICTGTSTNLAVAITGGSSPYSVVYSGGTVNSYTSGANISVSPVTTTGYTLTSVTDANGCTAATPSGTPTVTVNPTGLWLGGTTAWETASNWCGGVPTSTSDITIPTGLGNYPTIANTPTAVVRNVTVENSAALAITATGKLQVHGNWANVGTFTPNAGTVEFMGGTQALANTNSGTESFYNLTKSGSGTLTVNSNAEIKANGTLTVSAGTLDVVASKTMALRSVAPILQVDQTARLANVAGTITGTSTFTVERFIGSPSSRAPYNYLAGKPAPSIFLAPSVKSLLASQWTDDIQTNFGTSTSSLAYYSELNGTGSTVQIRRDRGWRFVMNSGTALVLGKGYRVAAGLDTDNDLLSVTGYPQTGDLVVPVTYTALGTQGLNLLGNPYPSEIDFNAFYTANSGVIGANMFIMDPYNTTDVGTTYSNIKYLAYNAPSTISVDPRLAPGTTGTSRTAGTAKYIASSQAFFVEATVSGNVNFTEAMKANAPTSVYGNFRMEEDKELIRLNVTDANNQTEQAVVHFRADASDAFDKFDAPSLSSSIYTIASGRNVVINGMPSLNRGTKVPLVVSKTLLGKKSLKVAEHTLQSGDLYLKDNYLNKMTLLSPESVYEFEYTSDTASSTASRFALVGGAQVVTGIENGSEANSSMLMLPNPYTQGVLNIKLFHAKAAGALIEILSASGNLVYSQNVANDSEVELELEKASLSSGVYTVRCITSSKTFVERLVIVK